MMKTLSFVLFVVTAAAAQSSGGPCGASIAIAAVLISAGKMSPWAIQTSAAARSSGAERQRAVQVTNQRSTSSAHLLSQVTRLLAFQTSISRVYGTVVSGVLAPTSTNQEGTILPRISGSCRFQHVLIQEAVQFVSASVANLGVAAGRPGVAGEVIPLFALKPAAAPQSFWFDRPAHPQSTGTYDLDTSLTGPSPLGSVGGSSFSAGSLSWEICYTT